MLSYALSNSECLAAVFITGLQRRRLESGLEVFRYSKLLKTSRLTFTHGLPWGLGGCTRGPQHAIVVSLSGCYHPRHLSVSNQSDGRYSSSYFKRRYFQSS